MMWVPGFSWPGKLLAWGTVAAGVGLAAGLWLHIRSAKELILRFEQPEIDLRERAVIEGEPINVVAKLHNCGTVPLRITNMPVSCGCMAVTDGKEGPPSEIGPGVSIPIHLRINTLLRVGDQLFGLQVQAQTPDGRDVEPAHFVVSASIMALLEAQPQTSWLVVHEEDLYAPLKQTVVLADLWPGEGLPIKSITSTLGDKLHYQLVTAHGEIGIGPRMLHHRYNLELSLALDPMKTAFDHTVTITPDHPKAKPVEVRLFGKIIPRCGLEADSVAFCGTKPGERITRRIEYHYRNPLDREIRLVKAPSWLTASVSDIGEGRKWVTLTCTLPEGKGERVDKACFEFGRDNKRSIVPVIVSSRVDDPKRPG